MPSSTQTRQSLNTATSFSSVPIEATHQGQPVLVIATGDVEGQSPSFQIVDQAGMSRWVPIEDVKVEYRSLLTRTQQTRTATGS